MPAAIFSGNRQARCRRGDLACGRFLGGTLIHNGNCSQPDPIGPLTITLIQSAFGAVAMTTVGRSALLPSGFVAAPLAAILLAPITTAAEPEHRATLRPPAKPLTEKIFSCVSHAHPKARLDSNCRSWQPKGGYVKNLSHERYCQWTPVEDTIGVSPPRPSAEAYTKRMTLAAAPAARMMLRLSFPASVQKTTDSDDR